MFRHLRWWWMPTAIVALLVVGGVLVLRQHRLREGARLAALQLTLDAMDLRSQAQAFRLEAALPLHGIDRRALEAAQRSEAEAAALESRAAVLHRRIDGLDWLTLRPDEIPDIDTTEARQVVRHPVPLPAGGSSPP